MSADADNIIRLNIITKVDLDAAYILRNIADGEPQHVFVIEWPKDGSMPKYSSSTGDMPVVLMRMQEFIHRYYNGDFSK